MNKARGSREAKKMKGENKTGNMVEGMFDLVDVL